MGDPRGRAEAQHDGGGAGAVRPQQTSGSDRVAPHKQRHPLQCWLRLQGTTSVTTELSGSEITVLFWCVLSAYVYQSLSNSLWCTRPKLQTVSSALEPLHLHNGCWSWQILIWNLEIGEPVKMIDCHTDVILSMSFNTDGSLLATSCKDKKLRIIEPRSGAVLQVRGRRSNPFESYVIFNGSPSITLSSHSKYGLIWMSILNLKSLTLIGVCANITSSNIMQMKHWSHKRGHMHKDSPHLCLHQQASCKNHRVNRVVFLGNMKRLLTTGVSRWNTREIALWDQVRRDLRVPCRCDPRVGVCWIPCVCDGFPRRTCLCR